MKFEDFIGDKVKRCEPDSQKAKALIKMSDDHLKITKNIPIDKTSAPFVLTNSYESLRQIIESINLKNGYKVYSHEAYTFYLQDLQENSIAVKFDRLRKLRNGVNYYGKTVSVAVAKQALITVQESIKILKEKYLNK